MAATAIAIGLSTTAAALESHQLDPVGCVEHTVGTKICGANEVPGLENVGDVAVSHDGANVYTASFSPPSGAVGVFDRDIDGNLSNHRCIGDVAGDQGCATTLPGLQAKTVAVSPDGESVYVGADNTETLYTFDREPDGDLVNPRCYSSTFVTTCNDTGGQLVGLGSPVDVAVSPDGNSVYVADFGDRLFSFDREADGDLVNPRCFADSGTPCDATGGQLAGLDGAESVVVSPDGNSVYVASRLSLTLYAFDRAANGDLSNPFCFAHNGTATCDGTGGQVAGLNFPRDVDISPDGQNVYVASSSSSAVAIFDRGLDGGLTSAGCIEQSTAGSVCGGDANEFAGLNGALSVAVSADGRAVHVAASSSNALVSFLRRDDGWLASPSCFDDLASTAWCGADREINGLNGLRDLAVSPDSTSVYLPAAFDDAITHFRAQLPPFCEPTSAKTEAGIAVPVTLLCSDPNGDPVTLSIAQQPQHGTLGAIDQGTDTVTYSPDPGYSGPDAFSYVSSSRGVVSNRAVALISVGQQGPEGDPGPIGPPGPKGDPGDDGTDGEPAIKLLLLAAAEKVSARAGKKLSLRLATSAAGKLKGVLEASNKKVRKRFKPIKKTKNVKQAGTTKLTVKLLAKQKAKKGKRPAAAKRHRRQAKKRPLPKGSYKLKLKLIGSDGQKATDAVKVKIRR